MSHISCRQPWESKDNATVGVPRDAGCPPYGVVGQESRLAKNDRQDACPTEDYRHSGVTPLWVPRAGAREREARTSKLRCALRT
jgi:hypothetical protein